MGSGNAALVLLAIDFQTGRALILEEDLK